MIAEVKVFRRRARFPSYSHFRFTKTIVTKTITTQCGFFVRDEVYPVMFSLATQHFTVNNGVRIRAFITQSGSMLPFSEVQRV